MAFSITEFKGAFSGQGARSTLFRVEIANLGGLTQAGVTGKFSFTCKAASLPASPIGVIQVPYMGRKIKEFGDATYPEWSVTVMNDEDFLVRDALESWKGKMNGHESNIMKYAGLSSGLVNYKSDATVIQYSKDGRVLRQYRFVGIWPSNIGDIALSWENNDQIEEFPITFEYDYWLLDPVGDSSRQAAFDIL